MAFCAIFLASATICGFNVKSVEVLEDLPARMWRMEYAQNGAELVWIDCDDENRAFGIAFRTLPEDDSGIAHVIEHSVLCGSEKYPSRAPFVELLKSSPNTYLNACTGKDMTVYPVSSRNPRDFLNLIDVYLDAVLHPLSVKNDWAMRQEGWHYEFDGTNLTQNGIVYSEMKGSMANPGLVALTAAMKLLYPDTVYRFNSGGDPEHIPELTFEKYCSFHKAYYHPSNARIFLYGRIDLEKTLSVIGEALKGFSRREGEVRIPLQAKVSGKVTQRYESQEEKNRTILCDGWVYGDYADVEEQMGLEVLTELLVGSNFSPIKKPLLEKGLCEDVSFGIYRFQQPMLMMTFHNVKDGQAEACRREAREALRGVCEEGIDADRIAQLIDKREFSWRERDTANLGVAIGFDILDVWLYGGDPAENLRARAHFAALRKRNGTGWYERLLAKATIENAHHCEVTLLPSSTLHAEKIAKQEAMMKKIRGELSKAELAKIVRDADWLRRHQSESEDPALLAKLPTLSLSDIPRRGRLSERTFSTVEGVTVIRPKLDLEGFFYLDLCFSLTGLDRSEMLDVPLLSSLYGEIGSSKHTALELRSEMDGKLGDFTAMANAYEKGPQLVVHIAALESHREDALNLAEEILLGTTFAETNEVARVRAQNRESMIRSASGRGALRFADLHAAARANPSPANVIAEIFDGVSQLRHLQTGSFGDLKALSARIFTRSRLTVCVAGDVSDEFLARLVSCFPEAENPAMDLSTEGAVSPRNDGFVIDGMVGYSISAMKLPEDVPYCGSQQVAAKIVELEYLWPEVRMKGGAYGANFTIRPSGNMAFSSYRDSNPARTYEQYARAGAWLAEFAKSGTPIEKYQISVVNKTEPNLSKREEMAFVRSLHFNGREPEMLQRLRTEILDTTGDDLLKFASALERSAKGAVKCAFGGEGLLRACALDHIEKVSSF